MPILYDWDDEGKTIIRYDYVGQWTWDELRTAVQTANEMIEKVDHPVDVIVDLRNGKHMPKGALSQGRQVNRLRHANFGIQVTVGSGMFVQALATTFNKLYGTMGGNATTFFADTLEDARKLIADRRLVNAKK